MDHHYDEVGDLKIFYQRLAVNNRLRLVQLYFVLGLMHQKLIHIDILK